MSVSSCLLTEMSPSERKDAAARAGSVAVLPIGATEQHGPHLPVGTDSLIGKILTDALIIKRNTEDRFVIAPQLQVSKSTEHLDFHGTLSLNHDLFVRSVTAAVDQLRKWRFERIALMNTHGGNGPVLRSMIREADARGDGDLLLLDVAPDLPGVSEREKTYGIHAGEYETSLLLARVPDLCHMQRADTVWIDEGLPHPDLQPENAPATFAWVTKDLSASGTMGDATAATPQKGEEWVQRAVELILFQLRGEGG